MQRPRLIAGLAFLAAATALVALAQDDAAPPPALVTVEAAAPSPEPAGARVRIRAQRQPFPLDAQPTVTLEVTNFRLGVPTTGPRPEGVEDDPLGQHVALAVDDDAYVAIYDASRSLVLGRLTPGTHLVRAVLVRSWGESLKSEAAFDRAEVAVASRRIAVARREPLLTIIQPRGVVSGLPPGEALLDFRLQRVTLAPGRGAVRLIIDRQQFHLTQEGLHRVRGLAPGFHAIELQTLNGLGEPLLSRFAQTSRVFTMSLDAPQPIAGAAVSLNE